LAGLERDRRVGPTHSMAIDYQKHLRLTQQLTHVASWEWDLASDEIAWSGEHYRIFGLTREHFTPTLRSVLERVHPADLAELTRATAECKTTRAPLTFEFRLIRPDSTVVRVIGRGVWDEAADKVCGITEDVTARKRRDSLLLSRPPGRTLAARLLEAQESERRHIARELHDEIGQVLTAVQIGLQRVRRTTNDEIVDAEIDRCAAIAARALEQVRGLSLNLHPPHLDDFGLESALRWLLNHQCASAGLAAHFHAHAVPRRLSRDLALACFRIVQEALTNIRRHANASEIRVELRCADGVLSLTVEDDGCGFDVAAAHARAASGASLGVIGMRERAALAGGTLAIEPRAAAGTLVAASFPLAMSGAPATRR
jgi:two-component system sensor histidine kinase UhpB